MWSLQDSGSSPAAKEAQFCHKLFSQKTDTLGTRISSGFDAKKKMLRACHLSCTAANRGWKRLWSLEEPAGQDSSSTACFYITCWPAALRQTHGAPRYEPLHLQDALQLFQFGFPLLNLTITVGSQVHHKLSCNVQHFLLESRQSQASSNSASDSPLYSCKASRWLHPVSGPHRHSSETHHFIRHSSGRTNFHTAVCFIPTLGASPVQKQAGASNCPTP